MNWPSWCLSWQIRFCMLGKKFNMKKCKTWSVSLFVLLSLKGWVLKNRVWLPRLEIQLQPSCYKSFWSGCNRRWVRCSRSSVWGSLAHLWTLEWRIHDNRLCIIFCQNNMKHLVKQTPSFRVELYLAQSLGYSFTSSVRLSCTNLTLTQLNSTPLCHWRAGSRRSEPKMVSVQACTVLTTRLCRVHLCSDLELDHSGISHWVTLRCLVGAGHRPVTCSDKVRTRVTYSTAL